MLDQLEVVGHPNEGPRVTRELYDGAGAEDGVDRPPLKAELAKIRPREERVRISQSLGGGLDVCHTR